MTKPLTELAARLGQELKQQGKLLAAAESCTGGGVAYILTEIAGSSNWFERGFVTYSNQAKIDMLNVPVHVLDTFGAVSQQTAEAMASGTLLHSQADISLAVTGIAGPGGGSADKPVGTVWFAWAWYDSAMNIKVHARMQKLEGDRHDIREQSIEFALLGCLECL